MLEVRSSVIGNLIWSFFKEIRFVLCEREAHFGLLLSHQFYFIPTHLFGVFLLLCEHIECLYLHNKINKELGKQKRSLILI